MKAKLSKIALAIIAMHTSIYVDDMTNVNYIEEETSLSTVTAGLTKGWHWGLTSANACDSVGDLSNCHEFTYDPPDYDDPWWESDPEPDPDPDYDYDYDNGGDSGGGGSGSNGPAEPTPEVILDQHAKQDAIATLTQVVNGLKQLLTQGVKTTQAAKINKIIDGLNSAISTINAADQITDHTQFSAQAAEAIAFAASLAVGAYAASLGAPLAVGAIAGYFVGTGVEHIANEAFDTLGDLYTEFQEATPPNWQDEVMCNLAKYCDVVIPPIVLDMDGDGIELITKKGSRARMDIDGDSFEERISWVKSDDAILYIDHNMSGTIDETNEFSFASFAGRGASDLEGLKTFDINKDNIFDIKDEAFAMAGVWQDANENAKAEPNELKSFSQMGITSIKLIGDNAMEIQNDSVIANNITYTVTETDGTTSTKEAGDVLFYGNLLSGIKKLVLDDGNSVQEHENGKSLLDLSKSDESISIQFGSEEYAGLTNFNVLKTGTGSDIINVTNPEGVIVMTGKGKDIVYGNDGHDFIKGGKGADSLFGGSGNDKLYGGRGKDLLDGGEGNDLLKGGKGADIFVVSQGHDIVVDFDASTESIQFEGIDNLTIDDVLMSLTETNKGTMLQISAGSSIHLIGVFVDELSIDNFVISE